MQVRLLTGGALAAALALGASTIHARADVFVSLQADNGQFVVAENNGGGAVNANRESAGSWETFHLADLNGGDLVDGDPVAFQTGGGQFLQAVDGGGGAMAAIGEGAFADETFTLVDLDRPGDVVQSGDRIALRSANGMYACAEGGGGDVVNVNRETVGGWETFRLTIY